MRARFILVAALTATVMPLHASNLPARLLGNQAPNDLAHRTIVVTPGTSFVSVASGEIVKFMVGEQSVTWHFDGPPGVFSLEQIVPRSVLSQQVRGQVEPNPLDRGGQ